MTTDRAPQATTRYDILSQACPTRQVVTQIGSRWGLLIIHALEGRPERFNQLRQRVEGISQKMLTQNLRMLERDGVVLRTVLPTSPVTVEYTLTELGQGLARILGQLREWSYTNIEEIVEARRLYDAESGAGDRQNHLD